MISAENVKADYARTLTERATIRRYTGTGPIATKPRHDVSVRCRVVGYEAEELVGTIQQGDRKVIAYADDVTEAGMVLPLTANDKMIVRGKELAIVQADHDTRKIGPTLIAIEIQVRG